MSVVEGRNRSSDPQEDEKPPSGGAIRWILNFIPAAALFVVIGWGFLDLLAVWSVSADQGTSFFDPTGWAFIISCIVAVILYDLEILYEDEYEFMNPEKEYGIRGWLQTKYGFKPPVWWFNIVGPIVAGMVWGLLTLVQAAPLTVTVDRGEIHVNEAHEILVAGQTYQGSRRERVAEVYPTAAFVDRFPVRLQLTETDYLIGRISGEYQLQVTPELRERVRQNPPQSMELNLRPGYFDRMFVRQFIPALTDLARQEAQPGNTTVGDVNGWSRDRASVPMAVRIGMRLEADRVFPTWFARTRLTHASIDNWNREGE